MVEQRHSNSLLLSFLRTGYLDCVDQILVLRSDVLHTKVIRDCSRCHSRSFHLGVEHDDDIGVLPSFLELEGLRRVLLFLGILSLSCVNGLLRVIGYIK